MAMHSDGWQYATGVVVEQFESFAGVYCPAFGETHVVNAFPAQVLKYVPSGEPITPLAIAQQLALFLGEAAEDWEAPVRAVLEQLAELGIVERSAP
jgi:hypothetical protein